MKTINLVYLGLASLLMWNCSNTSNVQSFGSSSNLIVQEEGGSVSLQLPRATFYHDPQNPANNTAEWSVIISKPGKYRVWLSHATTDSLSLNYSKIAKLEVSDNHFEVTPACDTIIYNSKEVSYPGLRSDSYVGSVYFNQSGEYRLQVISDKILPKELVNQKVKHTNKSELLGVIFLAATR